MKIISSIDQIRSELWNVKKNQKRIGFIPTMGALHDGHLSLVQTCKKNSDVCVMSVFVNPTQFGPQEDFTQYPRPVEQDTELARKAGVDFLFLPTQEEMYPTPPTVFVDETKLDQVLCGPFRRGHFRGVCTVVNKFLNIIGPHDLYLGQKDGQQLRILEEMVKQLHIPTKVIPVNTFREESGLAMSSRNQYLSVAEKQIAAVIYRALSSTRKIFESGETKTSTLLEHTKKILSQESSYQIQYVQLLRWSDLHETEMVVEKSILAVAGFLGKTRLIDNILLKS